ncbi:hypothetical protein EOM33_01945 [Candidatus Saccharibacteria bacterium]|nr:hypothetical protein [Candidatus Saccharibacteria bacterium]
MKKVVFIDWSGTLSYSIFWEHLQDTRHPNHKHFPSIRKWLFTDNRDIINPWMRGDLSVDDVIGRMSQDVGINRVLIMDELRRSCEEMRFSVENLENIIVTIQKRGVKVVIATDNMDTFSRFTVPTMQLNKIFDEILNSYDIGHLKDDELPTDSILFFDKYLKMNGWGYDDAVLLDNSPDKSGKYRRLGFERILIDSPETLKAELEKFANPS